MPPCPLHPPGRLARVRFARRPMIAAMGAAAAGLLASGVAMVLASFGSFAAAGIHVHAMMATGVLMVAIYVYLYFAPWRRFCRAVSAADWAAAGEAIGRISLLVTANLILGLYRPWTGELLADGIPYDTVDMRLLRGSFGVILQDPVIFPGTVAENIAYGRPAATSEDIVRAAEMAGVSEFVDRLPGGYAARVGQEGALLSGGQRQRLAIARALLAGPQLLILDEPTTHLDDGAIARLRAALADLPRRPTVITITHDEALAGQADRVISLRDGQLTAPTLSPTTRFLA